MRDASGEFGGLENVPKMAITMGVGTIMKAKKVILMAWGEKKGSIIAKTLESPISDQCPATFLQRHHNCEFVIDEAAASELTRTKKPWLVCNDIKWTKQLIKKAVINLCFEVKKPILKLTSKDYIDHGLINLVKQYETANKVNIEVFNQVQHTITGWPGGKPNVDDLTRPERNSPFPKTTLVFSPHPDDDVLHMGGTLARLVEQGNNVHVVYQTTGNIAVTDDYVIQELDLCINFATLMNIDAAKLEELKELRQLFVIRQPGEVHSQDILQYKTSVLESESRAACRFLKIPEENIHFLRMPFYETGMIQKKSLSNEDIESVVKIMREVKPHQIFAAGDLVDPHGTHYLCLEAIVRALNIVDQDDWFKDCYIWLYRGAQYEWELEKIDMAVQLSPSELDIKNKAIYRHGSQCNFPAFPGEFRQNAEKRNRNNAVLYDKLGMAEYEAIEAFARYHFKHGDYLIKP
ncbi:Glucosamine-6-phosphate deaminase [Tritrichomonas foetus]|uniref:N-acetylglucosaminylphosphatidylinositol deacetylase n=1 Tax=Tritrichomonas foetus TaxID=1144522 RepID=A0A1J4L1E5_9EUKA|nr:Glucosamine-6-phosphate deaminase [Tritrichomonas foetus]|eukprot:OHT15782.1 Glucosamine-6-phosphate deaminase [Tritrichomonas foetus]